MLENVGQIICIFEKRKKKEYQTGTGIMLIPRHYVSIR